MTTDRQNSGPIWQYQTRQVLSRFDISPGKGLTSRQVKERRRKYGRNRLRESKPKSAWAIFIDQFKSLIMVLLAAAASLVPALLAAQEDPAVVLREE